MERSVRVSLRQPEIMERELLNRARQQAFLGFFPQLLAREIDPDVQAADAFVGCAIVAEELQTVALGG